jgi:hypothetical protein
MPKKSEKQALTTDELLAQFDELDVDDGTTRQQHAPDTTETPGGDVLQELENLAVQRPASRPSTPSTTRRTPLAVTPGGRSSEEKSGSRKSGDSTRPYHLSMTPADTTPSETTPATESPEPEAKGGSSGAGGGGWWGGIFATATAAVKQAEAAVKEIQKNEEAQRWAEQVRGNVGVLKGLGMLNPVASLNQTLTCTQLSF